MGIFSRKIDKTYADRAVTSSQVGIVSPWAPASEFERLALAETLGNLDHRPPTRDAALRIPGIKRAHGIVCTQFASIPKYEMNNEKRAGEQAAWLTNSASGVSPYHRDFGAASDWFFEGWAAFGFTEDMTDCLHIPFGMWGMNDDGVAVVTSSKVPEKYRAIVIAIPLGYGENGVLHDGADTIDQAQKIEAAYQNRLDNPIALTVLSIPDSDYWGYTKTERASIRDEWNEGRRKNSTGLKPKGMDIDFPAAGAPTDLFESGRNAVRLDLANHTGLPASIIEGVKQGGSGGGTEMRYQGVGNGGERSDLWEYGKAKQMLHAFEARMSLDDVVPSGHSIRGDLSNMFATPNPSTNPTSED